MRVGMSWSVEWRLLTLSLLVSCASAQSITGSVLERIGGRLVPLRKALVSAGSPDGRQTFAVTRTDGRGLYLLAGDAAGRLRLRAEKFGYLVVSAGGKKQTELNVSCFNAKCGPFDFELVKGAVVTGTAVDNLNEPVENAHIWLLTPDAHSTETAKLQGSGRTDDLGRFRIIGLPEGPYELYGAVGGRGGGDTTLRSEPVPIDIAAGEEIGGISLRLTHVAGATFTVAGRVAGVDLSLRGDHLFWMRPLRKIVQAGPRYGSYMYRLARDGAFTVEDVLPGDYVFSYSHNPRSGPQQRFPLGVVRVENEMLGLTLQPSDPSGFRGQVESDGSELPNHLSLSFVRADEPGISTRVGAAFPDFTFQETHLMPGTYRLSVASREFYIKSVRIGGKTLPPQGIELRSGEIRTVTLIVSSEFAGVRGRVKPSLERRGDEHAAAHYRVGLEGPNGIVSAQTDQNGAFAFEKLTPGPYRICAWSDRNSAEVHSRELWESAGAAVRSFPIEPGSEVEIDLTAVE